MSHELKFTRNEHGEIVVNFTITGWHDAFRWAFHMLHGQVEFGAEGRRVLQRMRRDVGAKRYDEFDRMMTGGKTRAHSIRPRNRL